MSKSTSLDNNSQEDWLASHLGSLLAGIFAVAITAIIIVGAFYNHSFPGDRLNDNQVWGEFGDFIGGTLNPVLSFLALLALLLTLWVQNRGLDTAWKQTAQQANIASLSAQISAIELLVQSLTEQIAQYNNLIAHGGGNADKHKQMLDRRDQLLLRLDKVYEELATFDPQSCQIRAHCAPGWQIAACFASGL